MALGMGPHPHAGALYRIHEPPKVAQQGRPIDDEAWGVELFEGKPDN